ncbi:MAG: ATP-binding SpoIIE family protein phosphatase [Myxococcota bacterium]
MNPEAPASDLQEALLSMQDELREAEEIFDQVLNRPRVELGNAIISSRGKGNFNGDLVIADESRTGVQWFLFGDFTGHGLAAALGTLFASQIFTAMVAKVMNHRTIVRELNRKLRQLLPTGRFMAAAVVSLDPCTGRLEVWNGALPAGFVWRKGQGVIRELHSRHPPLGVVPSENLELSTDAVCLQPEDRVLLMTDGIAEALEIQGVPAEQGWISRTIHETREATSLIDVVQSQLLERRLRRIDDASLLEIVCPRRRTDKPREQPPGAVRGVTFQFDRPLLADASACLGMVLDAAERMTPMTPCDRSLLSSVMAELFSNAMDHGLLRLDSSLKNGSEGLARYLEARDRSLAQLTHGHISVGLEWLRPDRVRVMLRHDGQSFDPSKVDTQLAGNARASGRGLALVRRLCEDLEYTDHGRVALATLRLGRLL